MYGLTQKVCLQNTGPAGLEKSGRLFRWLVKRPGADPAERDAVKPEHHWVWYERGEVLQREGYFEEALTSFERALELRPDYAPAWHGRGLVLVELKRYFDAVASYMTALKLEPTNLAIWHDRDVALAALRGQRRLAQRDRPCLTGLRPSLISSRQGDGTGSGSQLEADGCGASEAHQLNSPL